MLRVGLTGGIGSGKSTVAGRLGELGAVVIDADAIAREVVSPGSGGLAAVADRFGDQVLDADGGLDRAALGAVVFTDEQARSDLEAITHPRIAGRTREIIEDASHESVIVHDVPLLVEKHMGRDYHLVIVVAADEDIRIERLARTRGMTEADARARMAAQAEDSARRAAADVWLENNGTPEELVAAVDRLWHERLVPFEENVRRGIRSRRPEALRLVPSDPTWPVQADRVLARLERAFGDVLVTADHVGSTSVRDLLAKDVIDIQVGVRRLAAADARDVLRRVTEAGFPRADGDWFDNAKDGGPPWPKRYHGNADPGRVCHIHIREVGSPGWRWALLFRDWLRSDAEGRREYAAEKRRVAETVATVSEYAEAKEPWFDQVHERVEEWARRAGWRPRY